MPPSVNNGRGTIDLYWVHEYTNVRAIEWLGTSTPSLATGDLAKVAIHKFGTHGALIRPAEAQPLVMHTCI